MMLRFIGFGAAPSTGYFAFVNMRPFPSSGSPTPFTTRPRSSSPTGTMRALPMAITSAPGITPDISPMGMSTTRFLWKPTTSAGR